MNRSKSGNSVSTGDNNSGLLPPLKLVFIGDSTVGKTTFLYSYRKGEVHDNEKEHTSVLDGFTMPFTVNNSEHICLLWDTIGSTDFEKLRPLSYPKTDCFLICFAINNRSSFKNIQSKWIPEIQTHAPDIPFMLVGTKVDLRNSSQAPDLITINEVKCLLEETEAKDYAECSSADLNSIETVCKAAVQVFLDHQARLKAIKEATNAQSSCVIL